MLILSSCDERTFHPEPSRLFHGETLVYAKDSTGIFTYNPHTGENKQILKIYKEIVPETFKLINDSLLTFTTLESMRLDSVLSERIYTDTNKEKHSYLLTTYYWVVTEKVHLIKLSDGRHYIPQINEYYVHDFQSQKFSTFGFPGIMTFCISDTVTEHGRYYEDIAFQNRSCENQRFTNEFYEKCAHCYSESKLVNGVRMVTFDGNLIIITNGHLAGILEYNDTFSPKMNTIGYYSPDISGNGEFATFIFQPFNNFKSGGIYVADMNHLKIKRIADRKSWFPKISYKGDFVASKNHSRLITIINVINNTHICIAEGQYYEWAKY